MIDISFPFEACYGKGTITEMYGAGGEEVFHPSECITFIAYMHTGEYAGQVIIDDMGDCIAIPITKH